MRTIALLALWLMATGCTKLEDEASPSAGRTPATPPGIAPVGGLETNGAANAGGAPAPEAATSGRQGIIGKTTNQVVDLHAVLAENPSLKVVEQRPQGSDPISFALDAYVDVRSRVSTLGMQRDVQAHKALHDRYPTYAEFIETMRQHGIQFTMVEPYRMYAYDEKTGGIVVLEDTAEKQRRYQAAGIPFDE